MKVSDQLHASAALSLGKVSPVSGVGHRDGLDAVTKKLILSPYQKLNPGRPARSLLSPKSWVQPIFSTRCMERCSLRFYAPHGACQFISDINL